MVAAAVGKGATRPNMTEIVHSSALAMSGLMDVFMASAQAQQSSSFSGTSSSSSSSSASSLAAAAERQWRQELLQLQPVGVRRLLERCLRVFVAPITQRSLHTSIVIDPNLPSIIVADPHR